VPQPCYGGRRLPGWGPFLETKCIHVGGKDHEHKDETVVYASSVLAVHAEIEKLVGEGVLPERILLGGFSQGAAIALEATVCYGRALAGCIVLSGWATPRARAALVAQKPSAMPVLVCHGTKDDMVGIDCGEAAAEALRPICGQALQFHSFKGMAHTSCAEEMRLVASFVHAATRPGEVAADREFRVAEWEQGGAAADSDDGESSASEDDDELAFGYISKRALDNLKELLSRGAEISEEHITALTETDTTPDDEVMAPLSYDKLFADTGDIEDIGEAVKMLGAKRVAEVVVEATSATEVHGVEPATAAEWRKMQLWIRSECESEERKEDVAQEGAEDNPAQKAAAGGAGRCAEGGADDVQEPQSKKVRTSQD